MPPFNYLARHAPVGLTDVADDVIEARDGCIAPISMRIESIGSICLRGK